MFARKGRRTLRLCKIDKATQLTPKPIGHHQPYMAHPVAQAGRETHERESEAEQLFGLRWLSRPAEHVELGHWAGSSRASGDGKMDKRDVQQTGERRCDWEPRAVHFFASSSLTCQLARLLPVPRSVVAQGPGVLLGLCHGFCAWDAPGRSTTACNQAFCYLQGQATASAS